MNGNPNDSAAALRGTIERYNAAWNDHDLDLDAIIALHAPDMVFANHTAGEAAAGEDVRRHIGSIVASWPDLAFATRRLYVREGLVVQQWGACGGQGAVRLPFRALSAGKGNLDGSPSVRLPRARS